MTLPPEVDSVEVFAAAHGRLRMDKAPFSNFGPEWGQKIWIARLDIGASVHLHPGVEPAPCYPIDGGENYTPGCWLPVREERRLTEGELGWFARSEGRAGDFPVGVFRVPPEALHYIAAHAEAIWADHRRAWATREAQEAFEDILHKAGLVSNGEAVCIGPSRRRSGLRSTTYDHAHGQRIGLHIDSWDNRTLDERFGARNRLCMNLGTAVRHLYILPLTAGDLIRAVAVQDDETEHSPQALVRAFCQSHPTTGVLRFDVPSGFAYVAPTDSLVHDGGSKVAEGDDLVLTWLGQFAFRQQLAESG